MSTPPRPALPPQAALMNMVQTFVEAKALHAAAELGLADAFGAGERSADDIARDLGLHPGATYRLMRALATSGLWEETAPRQFRLCPIGAALRKDAPGGMRDYVLYAVNDHNVRVWTHAADAIRTGRPVFQATMGATLWEYLGSHADYADLFSRGMTALSTAATAALLAACDFSGIHNLLDVGGGYGFTLAEILKAFPAMQGAVLDLPAVTLGTRTLLAERGLTDRARAIDGSFFDSVPAGFDGYFMKSVLHDFDDERAGAILRNVRKAMGETGRLLVADFVVPRGNAPHPGKWMDLHMLLMLGGRERTEAEFGELFASAGFRLLRVLQTPSPISVLEGAPA